MILSGDTVHFSSEANGNISEHPVIHILTALPDNLFCIDAKGVPLMNVVIQHSRQQVIGGGDGMEISGKMKIQFIHRNHLGITAPGSSSLNAKTWTKRRLSQCDDRFLPQLIHRLAKTDGGRRLPFPCRGRIDGSHQNQLAVLSVLDLFPKIIRQLRLIFSIKVQILFLDIQFFCNLMNRLKFRFQSNLNI
jgi:hypothetical protein